MDAALLQDNFRIFHFSIKKFPIALLFLLIGFTNVFAQNGLKAEFYDGTNFDRFVTEKYVDKIQMAWYSEPPVPGINPHECSIIIKNRIT